MKIALDITVLNDQQKTGIAVYTYGLINELLKIDRNDQFILFGFSTFSTYNFLKNIEFKKYPNVKIKIIKLPTRSFKTLFLTWQKLNWPPIDNFIGPVDLFHSFNFYEPPQRVGKKVSTVFDITAISHPQWHQRGTTELDQTRFKRISKYSDLVIAISEHTKKDFLKYSPKSKVEVIYPAVAQYFNQKNDKKNAEKFLRKYDLEPGYILSVATLEPRKNLLRLVHAYNKFKSDIPLVLIGGQGWKNNELIEEARKNENIKITGYINNEDLPSSYQQALIFAYPSLYEGFGIPVLEAMSCGVSVLTSNTTALPEVGEDAVLYVNPNNTNDIAKKMKELIESENLRRQLKNKSLKQAKKFSWEKSAKKLLSFYHSL